MDLTEIGGEGVD